MEEQTQWKTISEISVLTGIQQDTVRGTVKRNHVPTKQGKNSNHLKGKNMVTLVDYGAFMEARGKTHKYKITHTMNPYMINHPTKALNSRNDAMSWEEITARWELEGKNIKHTELVRLFKIIKTKQSWEYGLEVHVPAGFVDELRKQGIYHKGKDSKLIKVFVPRKVDPISSGTSLGTACHEGKLAATNQW